MNWNYQSQFNQLYSKLEHKLQEDPLDRFQFVELKTILLTNLFDVSVEILDWPGFKNASFHPVTWV